jgi:hypothetical protein
METQENLYDVKTPSPLIYVNATMQLLAILLFQQYALLWPIYAIMLMLSVFIAANTFVIAISFSGIVKIEKYKKYNPSLFMHILLPLIYMFSIYHIYQIGYVVFASLALAHIIISLATNILYIVNFYADTEEK